MSLIWHTTASRTRVLFDGDSPKTHGRFGQSHKRLGHVRNVGNKVWRCEYYPTGETKDMDSLTGAKTWLEMHHKMK